MVVCEMLQNWEFTDFSEGLDNLGQFLNYSIGIHFVLRLYVNKVMEVTLLHKVFGPGTVLKKLW